jgi:hypothetical protein
MLQDTDDNDEKPARSFRDPDDLPTREDIGREGQEFHDEWSRRNPNRVYGYSYPD